METLDNVFSDKSKYSEIKKFLLRGFFIGIIFHFAQLAYSGYNGDSLGFGFYYHTYTGELEQGRYGLLLFSGRAVNPAIEFIGSLFLYSLMSYMTVDLVSVKLSSVSSLLIQGLIMSQPHLATYSTFSYASFPYTIAYTSMVFSAYIIKKSFSKHCRAPVFSSIAVAVSFSIWQGYIPTFTTLSFIALVLSSENKDRIRIFISSIITGVSGTVLYLIGMKLVNFIYGLSPTDARGFASVLSMKLPLFKDPVGTVFGSYYVFVKYLIGNGIVYNGTLITAVHIMLGLFMTIFGIIFVKKEQNAANRAVLLILLLLTPMAFCFYKVLSDDVERIPWTYLHSMIFIWIMLIGMLHKTNIKIKTAVFAVYALIAIVICHQVYICNIGYSALKERDIKSESMALAMYSKLIANEHWNDELPIMVTGSMDEIYKDSNWYYYDYLKGWQPQRNEYLPYPVMPQNWVIQMNRILGTSFRNISYADDIYQTIIDSKEYGEMNVWPHDDCMKVIDGVMVIKLKEISEGG